MLFGKKRWIKKGSFVLSFFLHGTIPILCAAQVFHLYLPSGCLKVSYCSKQCQRDHWRQHKPSCNMDMTGNLWIDFLFRFRLQIFHFNKPCQIKDVLTPLPCYYLSIYILLLGVVEVTPVSNPYTAAFESIHMFNVTNNGVYSVTGCMDLDKSLPRNIVVKIQVLRTTVERIFEKQNHNSQAVIV